MHTVLSKNDINNRLSSIDFMRGFIMFLLVLESTGLYHRLMEFSGNSSFNWIFTQFHHHPWNGLRFWDLVQPGFMFIAGVALALSVESQTKKGISASDTFIKMLKRCAWLFFWGVLLYAVRKTGLSFELWNVLTQLSFTLLLSYLIFHWKNIYQVVFCIGLLLLTEALYRYTNVPNFNQPFTNQHNFGNYVDLLLMNKTSKGGWVAINCIPTSVHTISGSLIGKLILSKEKNKEKTVLFTGILLIIVGYSMDALQITPIIKRIATSSFTIASLGWCLIFWASCYFVFDRQKRKDFLFFKVLSMNSIFVYLLFETVGVGWMNNYMNILVPGILHIFSFPDQLTGIISSISVFTVEWSICLFLYRKKIFFRL